MPFIKDSCSVIRHSLFGFSCLAVSLFARAFTPGYGRITASVVSFLPPAGTDLFHGILDVSVLHLKVNMNVSVV